MLPPAEDEVALLFVHHVEHLVAVIALGLTATQEIATVHQMEQPGFEEGEIVLQYAAMTAWIPSPPLSARLLSIGGVQFVGYLAGIGSTG